MPDPQKPHDDERIEELLSQLQGIFGKLSNSEEEESKQKLDLPARPSTPAAEPPPVKMEPPPVAFEPPAPPPAVIPPPEPVPAPTPEPPPATTPSPEIIAPIKPEEPANAMPTEPPMAGAIPHAPPPTFDAESTPTVVFYPAGREAEAAVLAQKLEVLTPKFTKVNFRLIIAGKIPYDPKSDFKTTVAEKAQASGARTLFMIVDRALEDARRKPLTADLESRNIYFQEVPLLNIEKKAFYTDLLLGLVFFFDSLKPKE